MYQEDIYNCKKELRRLIKERKKLFSPQQAALDSEKIFSQIEMLPQFQQAEVVLAYWSLTDEVITHQFVQKWAGKKRLVLPIVVGETLELRAFNGVEKLITSNSFGILEPKTEEIVDPKAVDFAIIPGVAFDKKGNRLGRGKGFYDRFLKETNAFKVAVGYDFQILDEVPVSSFDVPVDMVVSTN